MIKGTTLLAFILGLALGYEAKWAVEIYETFKLFMGALI